METVTIRIDGQQYEVEKGIPLVLAAERAGIRVPHLCFNEGLSVFAGCRLCVVEIEGARGFPTSCTTLTADGQVVWTKTPGVLEMQRGVMSLVLADHPDRCLSCQRQEHCGIDGICLRDAVVTYRCLTCAKNKRCEFQSTSEELEMHKYPMRYYQESHSWYGPDHVELPIKRDNPFIELDFNECILCARCVRACDEVRGLGCYELSNKGPLTRIDTAFSLSLQEVGCDGCGACVDVCPVACILDKPSKWKGNAHRIVRTTCPFCGDGDQLDVEVQHEKILRVSGSKVIEGVVNITCPHGRNGLGFVHDPARIKTPLIKQDGRFVEATWDAALALVAGKLGESQGAAFAATASPGATNEELFALQKFTRSVMASDNISIYDRMDGPALTQPLTEALGHGAATGSYEDIGNAQCVLLMASDVSVTHPQVAWQIRRAARFNNGTLVLANPRATEMDRWASQRLRYRPGAETALLAGIMNVIIGEGLAAQEFIDTQTEGFAALQDSIAAMTPERAAEATGVPLADLQRAARSIASGTTAIVYDFGITQFTNDTATVAALVNLALLTGNLGKPGAGLFPLRGSSNQQGAEDMGCLPVQDQSIGLAGLPAGLSAGSIKSMLILGADPVADNPQRQALLNALERAAFTVAMDSFLTATARLADVVLPLATALEQDGTFTNSERRIQRVQQVLEPAGESRSGWQVLAALASRMGSDALQYETSEDVLESVRAELPNYAGVMTDRLTEHGLQWPCNGSELAGTPTLYTDGFGGRKAQFLPLALPAPVHSTGQFPLLLAVGRDQLAYHKEVLTVREDPLTRPYDEELVQMHPGDALPSGIMDGDVLRIVSPEGRFQSRVAVSDSVPQGAVFLSVPYLADSTPVADGPLSDLLDFTATAMLTVCRVEKAG